MLCLTEPLCFRYRVVVEGERGNRPHIYCLEQLLQEAVCAARGCLSSVPMPWGGASGLGEASWKLLQLQGCPAPAPMVSVGRTPLGELAAPWPSSPLRAHSRETVPFSRAAVLHASCGGMVCAGARVVSNPLPLALSRSSM